MPDRMHGINELLQQKLSHLIQADSEELGIVSVIAVSTSRDLSNAEVLIAPLSEHNHDRILKQLERKTYSYRHELLKQLEMRRIPALTFRIDLHREELNRVEQLLDSVSREHE